MTDSAPYAKSRVKRETNRSTPSLGNLRSEIGMRSISDIGTCAGSLLPLFHQVHQAACGISDPQVPRTQPSERRACRLLPVLACRDGAFSSPRRRCAPRAALE